MRLKVYRGTREIGGTCIEIATDSSRLILDAGLPLVDQNRQPFDQSILREKTLQDLVNLGVAPKVPGVFVEGDPPEGILLSHSHLDHSGLLHLTPPTIPIYCSSGTSKMLLAGAVFGRQKELDKNRLRLIIPGQVTQIGEFGVEAFAVDHSAFGSLAFLIEVDGKTVLYSGDLRWHGRKPGMIKNLVEKTSGRNIDLLLMEGTHLGNESDPGITEFALEEEILGHIQTAPGLVVGCFSPIDVDHFVTFYRACQRAGRTFVADAYAAFVLHLAAKEAALPRPKREKGIRVFFNHAFEKRNITKLKNLFEPDRIQLEEIRVNPAKFVMAFRPSMLELDFGGNLPCSTRCLFSYWKGYLEKPEWIQLQDHLQQTGGDFLKAHTSGHIYVNDLVALTRALGAKAVLPIHTFEPGKLGSLLPNIVNLKDGQILILGKEQIFGKEITST